MNPFNNVAIPNWLKVVAAQVVIILGAVATMTDAFQGKADDLVVDFWKTRMVAAELTPGIIVGLEAKWAQGNLIAGNDTVWVEKRWVAPADSALAVLEGYTASGREGDLLSFVKPVRRP